jgi:hypothetical protein
LTYSIKTMKWVIAEHYVERAGAYATGLKALG